MPKALNTPEARFLSARYQRINVRRQEHLATLGLPIAGRSVLEVGAGVGDHTSFFLDRGCRVTALEARPENVELFRERVGGWGYRADPAVEVVCAPVEDVTEAVGAGRTFEVVYCYGLLYHTGDPAGVIEAIARHCSGMLLLETCSSFDAEATANTRREDTNNPTQSFTGQACRPSRPFLMRELRARFEHVYVPATQPAHEQFPLDWSDEGRAAHEQDNARAIFVASRAPLAVPGLLTELPMRQTPA
ncbi:MAG: class I SAM-dependent methyltransferase [Phycisphaerales bacterium]